MNIFIPWWAICLLPIIGGTIYALTRPAPSSWYDVGTPMLALFAFLGGLIATICLFLGHWL